MGAKSEIREESRKEVLPSLLWDKKMDFGWVNALLVHEVAQVPPRSRCVHASPSSVVPILVL